MKTKLLFLSVGIFALASCAHHRDVRAGADGTHHVVVREPTREAAERNAIGQANHFCEETEKKHAAFVNEKTQYTGSMDEDTRTNVRRASQAAMVLGGVGAGAGRGGVRTSGGVVGAAGTAGAIITGGDDYVSEMSFKCQ